MFGALRQNMRRPRYLAFHLRIGAERATAERPESPALAATSISGAGCSSSRSSNIRGVRDRQIG